MSVCSEVQALILRPANLAAGGVEGLQHRRSDGGARPHLRPLPQLVHQHQAVRRRIIQHVPVIGFFQV
jgi:hypothetical protein